MKYAKKMQMWQNMQFINYTEEVPHNSTQWRTGWGGGFGVFKHPLPPEIPKALQNRAKLNPIVTTVKNCWI